MAIVEFKDVSRVYVSGDRTLEAGKASSSSFQKEGSPCSNC